jgi:hypothetical protein
MSMASHQNRLLLAMLALCPAAASSNPLSNQEIYQLNRRSVMKISVTCDLFDGTVEKRDGAGFLISGEGHVITSYHLVGDPEDCKTLVIQGSIRNVGDPFIYDSKLQLLPFESDHDVSLLKVVTPLSSDPIPLRETATPAVLEDFVFLTYSLATEVSGTPSTIRGPQSPAIWQTNHAFNPGDSGAPLIDRQGRAIGLVLGRVGSADVGLGPINVQAVGWMVASVPAIRELVAGAAATDSPIRLASLPAQPSFAIEAFDISLVPDRKPVAQICPPLRACLPVDPDGAPVATMLTRKITAPSNSVIDKFDFAGVERGGSLDLAVKSGRGTGELRAMVSASENAFLGGKVKVYFAPLLIQMAYPVDLEAPAAEVRTFEKVVASEIGYRFVKAEYRAQGGNTPEKPEIKILDGRTSLRLTLPVAGVENGGSRASLHGLVVTTQERIPVTTP